MTWAAGTAGSRQPERAKTSIAMTNAAGAVVALRTQLIREGEYPKTPELPYIVGSGL